MCLHSKASALAKGRASYEKVFTLLSFFLSYPSSLFFPPLHNFSQVFLFHQLIAINYGLHLRLIQTLCLHLSRSTPLRKTLTFNHYLHIEYFQHGLASSCSHL